MIQEIVSELKYRGSIVVSRADGKVERHIVSDSTSRIIDLLSELAKTKEKVWFFSVYFLDIEETVKEENVEIVYLVRSNSNAYRTLQYDDNDEIVYLPENPDEIIYDDVSLGLIMRELDCTNLSYELWTRGCKYLVEMCKGITLNRFLDIVAETADEYHKPKEKPKNWDAYTTTSNSFPYPKWINDPSVYLTPPVTETELHAILQEAEDRAVEEINNTWYQAIEDTPATDPLTMEAILENAQQHLDDMTRVIPPPEYNLQGNSFAGLNLDRIRQNIRRLQSQILDGNGQELTDNPGLPPRYIVTMDYRRVPDQQPPDPSRITRQDIEDARDAILNEELF